MIPFNFENQTSSSASSGISGASTVGPGVGDWTVAVGGSGANSGSATSTSGAGLSQTMRLALIGGFALAALWILKK